MLMLRGGLDFNSGGTRRPPPQPQLQPMPMHAPQPPGQPMTMHGSQPMHGAPQPMHVAGVDQWGGYDETASEERSWQVSVIESSLRSSISFCYGLWCSCCMVATQRMDILEVIGEPYLCCGGMFSCQPLSDEWDLSCVWCEAFCCCACALAANRFLMQTRFNLQNSNCDNCMLWTTCFIKYGLCLWQCCCPHIFTIPQDVECCTDIAEVMVEACLLAQQAFELEQVVARGLRKNPAMSATLMTAPGQQSMSQLVVPQLNSFAAVGCAVGAIGGGASGALALSTLGGPPVMGTARAKQSTSVNDNAVAAYNPQMFAPPPGAQMMVGMPPPGMGGPPGPPGVGMPPGGGGGGGMMGVVPDGPQPTQLGMPMMGVAPVGAASAAAVLSDKKRTKSKKNKSRNPDAVVASPVGQRAPTVSTFCKTVPAAVSHGGKSKSRTISGTHLLEDVDNERPNFGPFLQLVAPNGITWSDYCSGRPVEIEPSSGALTGNWGECMAWAKIYELQTPDWESDPDYSSMGPCDQVRDAVVATNPDVPRKTIEEACKVLQLTCQAAAKTGALVPTKQKSKGLSMDSKASRGTGAQGSTGGRPAPSPAMPSNAVVANDSTGDRNNKKKKKGYSPELFDDDSEDEQKL